MTWRSTGLLIASVLVLGLYAWWSSPPDPALRRTAARHPLLVRDVEPTRVVVVATTGTLRLDRDAHGWSSNAAGERLRVVVESLLAALRTVEPLMVVGQAPRDLERFGLDPPATRLEVWVGTERVLGLDIGHRNPAWTGLYTRRAERPEIELVGAVLYWEIAKLLATTKGSGDA
jgi:hypothetical protein